MAALLERTQALRQHIEALIRRDAAKRSLSVDERALRRRVDDYYLPMFRWTTEVVEAVQKKQGDAKRCVCIGLSCPQGGGKTTASMYMQDALALMGKKCAVMSLDDVYWKYEEQVALAKANPGNPLLQVRGGCCVDGLERVYCTDELPWRFCSSAATLAQWTCRS
jgi:hypothetical protein